MTGEVWLVTGVAVVVVASLVFFIWLARIRSRPLPALDRTPRSATVRHISTVDESEVVWVEYDLDGVRRTAGLADLIHHSWIDRFEPGTTWQIYAFRDAGSRVLLAEAHDDVVRRGYNLDGVRIGGESGPAPVGPGSPFLHGRRRFEDDAEASSGARTGTFDTSALSGRIAGGEWRAFRRAALTGAHGADLAVRHWWKRYEHVLLLVVFVVALPTVPVALILDGGPTFFTLAMSALWVGGLLVAAVISLWVRRVDHWVPKMRARFRVTQFTRANGLTYDPTPHVARPAAQIFDSASPRREHLDLIVAPGPRGFRVANYREERGWDGAEPSWYEAGYAVFALHESFPHFFAAAGPENVPAGLRRTTPVDHPGGYRVWCAKPEYGPLTALLADSGILDRASRLGGVTEVEIVGSELFVVHGGGFWPLTSPAFWGRIDAIVDGLAPFLARER